MKFLHASILTWGCQLYDLLRQLLLLLKFTFLKMNTLYPWEVGGERGVGGAEG